MAKIVKLCYMYFITILKYQISCKKSVFWASFEKKSGLITIGPRILYVNYLQFINDPTALPHSSICLTSLRCGFVVPALNPEHHFS